MSVVPFDWSFRQSTRPEYPLADQLCIVLSRGLEDDQVSLVPFLCMLFMSPMELWRQLERALGIIVRKVLRAVCITGAHGRHEGFCLG